MEKINFQQLKRLLPDLRKNVFLKNYTTFKIGGKAKYFFVAKSAEDLTKAIFLAKRYNLPFFILGGGSNLLISDKGFKGLVIKIENQKYKIPRTSTPKENKFPTGQANLVRGKKNTLLYAEAGVLMRVLVKETIKRDLAGLEWAAGIPGTLGGAIRGNAGAFGSEIGDNIFLVEALDKKGNLKKFSKKDCNFSYRSSIFKKKNLIVLAAKIKLKRGNRKILEKIAKDHIKYRQNHHPLKYPNAGSIFKNKKSKIKNKRLLRKFPQFKEFNKKGEIPAGFLIGKSGLKGKKIGKVQISKIHPNFIVNLGKAKSKDVKKLINLIKKKVKNKFGIELEEEIQYLNH